MKVGVLGSGGSIGSRHAANLCALGHQVIHFDPAVRMDLRFEREVYDHCDAVVIATPSIFHQSAIRAAAERGKHIFVEKPIGTERPDVIADLLALAKKNGAAVMVGCMLRFHPCVAKAEEWLEESLIGLPRWGSFTVAQKTDRAAYQRDGVTINWLSHEIDLALHLLGPAEVRASFISKDDDIADICLEHPQNFCRSVAHGDYIASPDVRWTIIVGDQGNMLLDLKHGTAAALLSDGQELTFQAGGSWDDIYVAEIRAFIDRIEGKDVPGATGEDGLAALDICLQARRLAGLQ